MTLRGTSPYFVILLLLCTSTNVEAAPLQAPEPEGPAAALEEERDTARLSRFSQMGLVPVEVPKTQPISDVHPDAQVFIQSLQRATGQTDPGISGQPESLHPQMPLADARNHASRLISTPKRDEAFSVPFRGNRLSVRKLVDPHMYRKIGLGKANAIGHAIGSTGEDSWK